MDRSSAIAALQGLFWLSALLLVVYWPWQKFCTDHLRDTITEQRDRIFDLALAGHIQFGSEAYERTRSSMGALIGLAHCLTLPRMIVNFGGLAIREPARGRPPLERITSGIESAHARDVVTDAWHKVGHAVFLAIIARSPLLIPLLAVIVVTGQFSRVRTRVESALLRPIETAIGTAAHHAT